MTRLPGLLLAIGSFVLVFSLCKIWEQASKDHSPFPPGMSMERLEMDTEAVNNYHNGRVDWITLPETWRP